MSILFGLLLARRFYCRSALSLSPGRTGGLLPRINAPIANGLTKHVNPFAYKHFYFIVAFVRSLSRTYSLERLRHRSSGIHCRASLRIGCRTLNRQAVVRRISGTPLFRLQCVPNVLLRRKRQNVRLK